jgi:antitoxin ParD1/3/4
MSRLIPCRTLGPFESSIQNVSDELLPPLDTYAGDHPPRSHEVLDEKPTTKVRPFKSLPTRTSDMKDTMGDIPFRELFRVRSPFNLAIFASRERYIGSVPTRHVNLTDELERYVQAKVKSGRYENASEVVRAALRTMEREEEQYQAKLSALRAAIDEGDASGVADDHVFERVREKIKQRRARP